MGGGGVVDFFAKVIKGKKEEKEQTGDEKQILEAMG
jgi:hypothetical protein